MIQIITCELEATGVIILNERASDASDNISIRRVRVGVTTTGPLSHMYEKDQSRALQLRCLI